jgi:hypothetical protein
VKDGLKRGLNLAVRKQIVSGIRISVETRELLELISSLIRCPALKTLAVAHKSIVNS